MEEQERSLPYRILGSAQGLACSTFSGVAGIEADLKDLRTVSKQRQTASARRTSGSDGTANQASSGIVKRPRLSGSFRSTTSTDLSSRAVEQEFESFTNERGSFAGTEHIGGVLPCLDLHCSPIAWVRTATAKPQWAQESGSGTNKGKEIEELRGSATELSVREHTAECAGEDLLDSSCGLIQQSVASERIQLLSGHISHDAILQRLKLSPLTPETSVSVVSSLQQRPESVQTTQVSHYTGQTHTYFGHERKRPRENNPDATNEEEEGQVYQFHCPYNGCHENLVRQNLSTSAGVQQKACVHLTCPYVSETTRDWLAHVLGAHHDIQEAGIDDKGSVENDIEMKG